jgi:hypothetical protein
MKKTNSRLLCIILIVSFIFISGSILSSCEKPVDKIDEVDENDGNVSYSPASGEYMVRLNPAEWLKMDGTVEQSFEEEQLNLLNLNTNFVITIDYYKKSDLKASDIDSFIALYKTFDNTQIMYAAADNKTFSELTDVVVKDIEGSAATGGKRQQIHLQTEAYSAITEIVCLESKNHFFAFSYICYAENFDEFQKNVNNVISRLKTK